MDASANEQLYDRVAEGWRHLLGEDLHWGFFTDPEESLAEATGALVTELAARSQLAPGLAVLDVGCGRGEAACALAARHRCEVTGIAPSAACVAIATAKAAQRGLSGRARFLRADGTQTGFSDGSFDRIWAMESSHLMDKGRLIAESARVLRPGGRFALCDLILRRRPTADEARELGRVGPLFSRVFGETRLAALEEYARLLRDHEFHGVRIEDVSRHALPSLRRWRDNAREHRAEVVASLGRAYADDFVASLDALEGLWGTGLCGYGIVVAERG